MNPTSEAHKKLDDRQAELRGLRDIADTTVFLEVAQYLYKECRESLSPSGRSWYTSVYLFSQNNWDQADKHAANLKKIGQCELKMSETAGNETTARTYRLEWKFSAEFRISVEIQAFLNEQVCERVQVGTKVVPVYEMRCTPSTDKTLPAPLLDEEKL